MKDKVSLKNPKDQKFENHEEKVLNAVEKTAVNTFKDKYFHEEYKGVFAFASVVKIISNLISFCTGFIALQVATNLIFGYYLSSFFAFSICLSLEGVKTYLWKINAKKYLKYKQISKPIICTLVALHLVSLSFSAYGGWMLPSLINAPKKVIVPEIKKDSLSVPFLAEMNLINEQIGINNAKIQTTTSNSTLRTFNSNVKELLLQKEAKQKALDLLIKEAKTKRSKKVNDLDKDFLGAKIKHNEEIRTARISCLIVSLFFELLFIACALFTVFYLFRLSIDLADENEESNTIAAPTVLNASTQNTTKQTTSTQQAHEAPQNVDTKPTKTQTIGFKQNSCVDSKKSGLDSNHASCVDSKKSGLDSNHASRVDSKVCALDGCSNTWTGGQHNKKYCSRACGKLNYQKELYKRQKSQQK